MPGYLFVVNPVSGFGKASKSVPGIQAMMDSMGSDYRITYTEYPGHAVKIVSDLEPDTEWRVFACGGDGTLNEVATGAAGKPNVAIAHYPCGTGNDFIRVFGDTGAFLDVKGLINGKERLIDCMELGRGRRALNICSVGVDADVAAEMTRFRWAIKAGGKMPYNLSLFYTVLKGIHRRYRVTLDGTVLDGTYCMLTACNGQTYGGGFHACPDAVPDDGVLDFLLVGQVSRLKLAGIAKTYASGRYKELPDVIRHVRGQSITIKADKPVNINYDGETFKDNEVTFSMSRLKLRFIVPDITNEDKSSSQTGQSGTSDTAAR